MHKRILVVEDDSLQRNLMTIFLGWHDFDVLTASNGVDAIRNCMSARFDLVLMDYRRPIVDGLSAAKLIRGFTREKGGPRIIALTATPDELREEVSCTDNVFAAVEVKPWDPHSLLETIGKVETGTLSIADKAFVHGLGRHRSGHGATEVMARLAPDLRREIAILNGRRPPGPVRVLVVEDDDFVRSLLIAALRAERYEVNAVSNGLEAIMELEQGHYDIALIDYRLPKIDGFVAAQLMGDLLPQVQRPRLIALTASPELLQERDVNATRCFDAIVPKSSDIQHVIAAIARSVIDCNLPDLL